MTDHTGTDAPTFTIPRPPCDNCGHPNLLHWAQGGEEGCAAYIVSEVSMPPRACLCPKYEPKSYDIEPGPVPPAQVDQPQQPPRPGVGDIQLLVIEDMEARREFGIAKYGTPLQAFNGRDALMDAYQEALDLAVYLRQAIQERMPDPTLKAIPPEDTIHIIAVHDKQLEVKPYSTCSCGWVSGPQMTAAQAREEWDEHFARETSNRNLPGQSQGTIERPFG